MASASLTAVSTPNVSRSADSLSDDFVQNECLRCHWMIHRSSLMRSRSRRPLSVDDVRVAEAFLVDISLDNLSESCDEEFCVFPPSPHSLSSSFSHSERPSKSSLEVTSTPSPQRDLQSCLEDAALVTPSSPSMEVPIGEINEDVGASWRKLGRHLLKRECVLNNIDADFSGVGEKAYQVLLKWKEENGATATPRVLFLAVIQIKRTDVAKKLIKLVPSLMSLSHLLDSVLPSGCTFYNDDSSKLNPENLEVKKILQSKEEKILVCSNSETSQRIVLKEVENEENAFAVRKCIDCKALRQQRQRLRKTEEFLEDLQMKQKLVQDLLNVIQHLQNHLHTQHQAICQEQFSCHNCGQYRIKQDLVEKELTLLHHELQRMIQGNRRISISGIPIERIYNLAARTYTVCEEHREIHAHSKNRRSMCQHPEDSADAEDNDDHLDGPILCALNVIWTIRRRRKVTQSLNSKQSSANSKMKLTKANSNPLSSDRNPLSNRQSYMLAQENPVTMPSLHTPGDWSGVPAFKMSSDFKKPSSSSNSSRCLFQRESCSKNQQNPVVPTVDKNDQLIPLQWLKGLEPEELII